jgi:hypothetical protein
VERTIVPFDPQPSPSALVTAEQVSSIAQRSDPVLRNLQITQSYHDLGVAVAERLGGRDACWVGFAVWASRTAGHFIRGEWLPDALRHVLARVSPGGSRRIEVLDAPIRAHLAEGNRKVYAEIAPLFVELVRVLDRPAADRPAALERSLASLRPGRVEENGQAALSRALRAFVEAASLPQGHERAQRILLGNLLIGAHEQYRLQEQIAGALDVVCRLGRARRGAGPEGAWRRLEARLRQHVTHAMVRLDLPGLRVSVGRDVPALPDGSMFPADLRRVSHPELQAVLARFDRSPNTTSGSAAADWGDYGDRMNYVVDLFRSRQQRPELVSPPFEPRQAAAIRAGYVPAGRL